MGVTKQYLRYTQGPLFGVVGSPKANIVFLDVRGVKGKYCAVGACEDVIVWDLRTGEKFSSLKGDKHEVTALAKSPDKAHIAVGYNDGMIKVFDVASGDVMVNFSGHKSTVTALKYDHQGIRLVSGAKDTDVIVWDIVNEAGLYRLKGHKGQITQVSFLKEKDVLITSSKDTFVKFWDLETQHCFKTLVGHRSEIRMKPGKVCRLVIVCAVLHNIAIKRNEPLVENDQDDHHDDQPQIPPFNGQQDGRGIRSHFAESFFA